MGGLTDVAGESGVGGLPEMSAGNVCECERKSARAISALPEQQSPVPAWSRQCDGMGDCSTPYPLPLPMLPTAKSAPI